MDEITKMQSYEDSQIQVLEGLEAVYSLDKKHNMYQNL